MVLLWSAPFKPSLSMACYGPGAARTGRVATGEAYDFRCGCWSQLSRPDPR